MVEVLRRSILGGYGGNGTRLGILMHSGIILDLNKKKLQHE